MGRPDSTAGRKLCTDLDSFETIKGVHLTIKPFAEEVLTPTLKVKR